MPRPTLVAATIVFVALTQAASAQNEPPSLRVSALPENTTIDGRLSEAAWESAEAIEDFRQTDPAEGAPPTARTRVQVLADARAIVIGIVCDEAPTDIVSFSVRRDAVLTSEDHVRIVLGPFADGRSGYVFAVNPTGARYDGLINPDRVQAWTARMAVQRAASHPATTRNRPLGVAESAVPSDADQPRRASDRPA